MSVRSALAAFVAGPDARVIEIPRDETKEPENLFTYSWQIFPYQSVWFSSHWTIRRSDGVTGGSFSKDADTALEDIHAWIANSEKGARAGHSEGEIR